MKERSFFGKAQWVILSMSLSFLFSLIYFYGLDLQARDNEQNRKEVKNPNPPSSAQLHSLSQSFECKIIRAYKGNDMWTKMVKCNYGREGAQDDSAFWWDPWSTTYDASALYDGSIILGNNPSNLAFFGGINDPAGEFWPYDTISYEDTTVGPIHANALRTRYYHNIGFLPLDIEQTAIAFDDTSGSGPSQAVIQDFIITNTGPDTIADLRFSIWLDWDISPNYSLNKCSSYPPLCAWIYYNGNPTYKFGMFKIPTEWEVFAERFLAVDNSIYVYPNNGWGWNRDSLWNVMNGDDHNNWDTTAGPADLSMIMTTQPFDLTPGESHTEAYIIFGFEEPPLAPLEASEIRGTPMGFNLFLILKNKGLFRGDVTCDCVANIADVITIANLYFGRPAVIHPAVDQGDVNCDNRVNLSDAIALARFVFGQPGAMIYDYSRFPQWDPYPCTPTAFNVQIPNPNPPPPLLGWTHWLCCE